MILFDDVVEMFDLAHLDRHVAAGIDRIGGRLIGSALVHRDLVRIAVRFYRFIEKAPRGSHITLRREQEVNGFSLLVDSRVQVFPDAFDL